MKDYMHSLCKNAKKNKDINMMKALYQGNPNNYKIKFEYAKMLIDINNDAKEKNMEQYEEARNMLIELLETQNRNYALFELGKLEEELSNIDKAKGYFNELLKDPTSCNQDREYATLELGRIERSCGGYDKAKEYFDSLEKTKARDLAKLELGRLEIENGHIEEGKEHLYELINNKSDNDEYAKTLIAMLYLKENDYDKLIQEIEKYDIKLKYRTLLYLSKKFNIFFNRPYNDILYSYTMNQILDYDEYMAIAHIVDRHNSDSEVTSFNPDIDIYKLFVDIKEQLIPENKIYKLILNDIYVIDYPNIGVKGEKYLKVVTMHDSKDILSMYPIQNKYDINYRESDIEKEEINVKIKNKTMKK